MEELVHKLLKKLIRFSSFCRRPQCRGSDETGKGVVAKLVSQNYLERGTTGVKTAITE